MEEKLIVIGLDSAPPSLLLGRFLDQLPTIKQLSKEGMSGSLSSCHPPITVPAWMVMMTGQDPGKLGIYGFRKRKPGTYNEVLLPSSHDVKEPKVWDIAAEKGLRSCVIGIPPTYPPKPINGCLITDFMTPGVDREYTYPPQLKQEIQKLIGEYIFDVTFRKENRDEVLQGIIEMTEKRFKVAKHLLQSNKFNLFILMEIGLDRMHHAFWKYFDKEHHLYQPGNKYENTLLEYYKLLDEKIGELLAAVKGGYNVLIVSDHGAKRMKGAFCVNQWMMEEGYLKLRKEPKVVTPIEKADVDWSRTRAWGWGGYYARIYINLEGREPNGVVKRSEYESFREELAESLKNIRGPNGERWETKVYKPEELYEEINGDPPDLIVYFDDLYWRSAGTIGHDGNYLPENDTGPDDAVHDYDGVFILWNNEGNIERKNLNASIYQITPTILQLLRINPEKHHKNPPLPL